MAKEKEEGKWEDLPKDGSHTTEPRDYDAHEVLVASCINGNPAPTEPCKVSLELSVDGVAWVPANGGRRHFGPLPGETYLAAYKLSDYAEQGAWQHARFVFGGNTGGTCKVGVGLGAAPVPPEPEEKDAKASKKAEHTAASHAGHHTK